MQLVSILQFWKWNKINEFLISLFIYLFEAKLTQAKQLFTYKLEKIKSIIEKDIAKRHISGQLLFKIEQKKSNFVQFIGIFWESIQKK